jgi:hypothetical protein
MASTYTTNTGIEKPGTGEQSGTWGDTVNTNMDLVDQSTNGIVEITVSSAATSGSPNSLPITNGALSNGRNKYIEFKDGGDLGATVYYQLDPNDAEKVLHVRNALTTRSLILFQGTYNSSNDIEIPNGMDMVVKFDGGGSGATVEQVDKNLNPVTVTATGDTSAGDKATMGYTSAEGLILTGQGSTNDVTIKNDADADVISIPTGTTGVTFAGAITGTTATLSVGDNSDVLTLVSTDTDASKGPNLVLKRDNNSGAADDVMGTIDFIGEDAGNNLTSYVTINSLIGDATGSSEDGRFKKCFRHIWIKCNSPKF